MASSMFNRDIVDLLKKDGTRINGIKATVASSTFIKIDGKAHVIDSGDLISRKIATGAVETYKVIDPTFYDVGSFGPHYQLKVQKLGIPEAAAAVQHITYSVSGHNARLNIDSVDNSINTVNIDSQVTQQLEAIREKILQADLPGDQQAEALEVVDATKELFASGSPKRSVVKALLGSLPAVLGVVASVATIVGAIAA